MQLMFFVAKLIEKMHVAALSHCKVEEHSKVCSGTKAYFTTVDQYTYIGSNCTVINASIGKFCSIADGCIIGGAKHPIEYVSTSPVFHEGRNSLKTNFSTHSALQTPITTIGNDVWIGNQVLIKAGVKIGNGAVIGMGSVVTHDIPDYEIWAGNPAHIIRNRFSDDIKAFLLEQKWWDWEIAKLAKYAQYFDDPAKLKKIIEGDKE